MENFIKIEPLQVENARTSIEENAQLGKISYKKENPYSFVGEMHYNVLSQLMDATSPEDSYAKSRERAIAIIKENFYQHPKFSKYPGLPSILDDIIIICFPTEPPFDWNWNGGGAMFRNNPDLNVDNEFLPALSSTVKNMDEILSKVNITDLNHAKETLKAINSMEHQLIKSDEVGNYDRALSQIGLSTYESSVLFWNRYFKDDYKGDSVFMKTGGPERIASADGKGAISGAAVGTVTGGPGVGTVVGGCLSGIASSWLQCGIELFW